MLAHAAHLRGLASRLPRPRIPGFELTGWDDPPERFIRCRETLTPGTVHGEAGVGVFG